MKLVNYLKSWNWTAFLLIVFVSTIGSLGNKTLSDKSEALLIGLIGGIILGLPLAFITRDEESKIKVLPDPLSTQDKPDETGCKVMIYRRKLDQELYKVMKFTDKSKDVVYTWATSIQGNIYHGWNEKNEPILKIPKIDGGLLICEFGDYLIKNNHPYSYSKVLCCSPESLSLYYEFVKLA